MRRSVPKDSAFKSKSADDLWSENFQDQDKKQLECIIYR